MAKRNHLDRICFVEICCKNKDKDCNIIPRKPKEKTVTVKGFAVKTDNGMVAYQDTFNSDHMLCFPCTITYKAKDAKP
jgi:hypothetical protein